MFMYKRLKFPPGVVFPFFAFFMVIALLLTACGSAAKSSSSSTGSGVPGSAATATSSSSDGGRYGYPTTSPTASPTTATGSGSALIQTESASVKGTTETILTNAQGMTLYYRTTDTATSVCSGGCASAWPPLLETGSGTPTSAASLPGKLRVITDANGSQVTYNGHPLYTFSGDTAPHQTNGEGVAGMWFVVPTNLS